MKNIFLFAIASLCFTFSCNSGKKVTSDNTTATAGSNEMLYQYKWNLTQLGDVAVPATTNAHLLFTSGQPGKVSGNTGCNLLNGSFELNKTSIRFSAFATTKRACSDNPFPNIENKFLDALAKSYSWIITDSTLILRGENNIVAVLKPAKLSASDENKLNGNWQLAYIGGTKIAFDGLFPNKKPTLTFKLPSTQISGNGGCNGYGGQVKIEGSNINFRQVIHTMMACDDINGENQYFSTLETVTTYSLQADTSLIFLKGDIAVMRFIKK